MGGPGSTRWRNHRKKPLAEESLRLNVERIATDAFRDPAKAAGEIRWSWSHTNEAIATVRYRIDPQSGIQVTTDDYRPGQVGRLTQAFDLAPVETLPGRLRWLARCPECKRRMAKAFWPLERTDGFACRRCTGITGRTTSLNCWSGQQRRR